MVQGGFSHGQLGPDLVLRQPLSLAVLCVFTPAKKPQVEGKGGHGGCRNSKQPAMFSIPQLEGLM